MVSLPQNFITQTNVPALGVVSFNSLFTNNLLPNGWTADLQTWWDPANQIFGLVNHNVGEGVFHTSGGSPSAVFPGVDTGNFGLFSVTETYTITANGPGNANNTISMTVSPSAVPGPIARCWSARPDLGKRWPSRLVATAAEDRLNIYATLVRRLRQPAIAEAIAIYEYTP
jgi:hypothetical protein